jgi:hypothetical protein
LRFDHNILSKEYYDKYIKNENEGICINYNKITSCKKFTKFESISKGYRKYCSCRCLNLDPYIRNKMEKTNEIKHKYKYSLQNPDILKKTRISSKKNNGVVFPLQNKIIREKTREMFMDKFILDFNHIIEYLNIKLIDVYVDAHYKHRWKCNICNNIFERSWNDIQQGKNKCPICFTNKSNGEIKLLDFIKSIESSEIIENSRNIIPPYELDIFIPDKNIAIEFDGLYWHSEKNISDKNYHLNKTEECLKKNIKLIHIFEDELIFKQEIVKPRLKQILNLNNNLSKIYARKCKIKEILPKIKNEFLNKYHIQGSDNSLIKLGAFYNDELISVMTFSHGNIAKGSKNIKDIWELSRFCSNSNYHIPGIASKLLSYFKKNYDWKKIYSYADRRWSDGNLYKKIGFELDSITKPNYFYIKGINRIHRFNLRKRPDEPKDITEWVLRQKEGYYRVYDCGHLKFIMENKNE